MAVAQPDKKRVSKASKRKAKKAPGVEEDPPEALPADEPVEAEADAAPPAKKRKTKANRLEEMAAEEEKEPVEPRGVIYLGHIPDGFAEPQMRKFFGQFGKLMRLRISRSKKNANSKGYAFIEFEEEGVAKIVAETMQGYLLFDKTLVCHLLAKEKQHPALFKGCRRRMINTTNKRRRKHTQLYNDRPTVEVNGQRVPCRTLGQETRRKKGDKKLAALLKDLGVDYNLADADESRPKGSPKLSPLSPAKASSPKLAPAAASSPKASPASPARSPKAASSPKAATPAGAPASGSGSPASGSLKKKKQKKSAA